MAETIDGNLGLGSPAPEYEGPLAFFRKHWNGDYSLARSYWLNSLLVTIVAPALGILLLPWLAENFPARYASAGVIAITALGVGAWCWAASGTWASATKHVGRGGSAGWATLAKVAICLGALKTLGDLGNISPALMEHARVASGAQLGEETKLELRSDGRSILISGGINDGSAAKLDGALNLAPSVTTVVLASNGGWIREGTLLAEVVRKRHLNTYVEGVCASACTIAFLAGKERAADPGAKIGFHATRAVGSDASNPTAAETGMVRTIYRNAGLPESFISKALDTPHASMWYPTTDEMIAANVLTRRSQGGETAAWSTQTRSREQLIGEFKKIDAFAAIAERSPAAFERFVNAAWKKLQAGATDTEVMTAARQELSTVIPQYLPLADDATLLDYQQLMLDQLQILQKKDPAACVEVAYPSGKAINIAGLLPKELTTRELALIGRVMRQADSARSMKPSPEAVQRVATRAAKNMTREQIVAFSDESTRRASPPALICAATINFMLGFNAIPVRDRPQALRTLYSAS